MPRTLMALPLALALALAAGCDRAQVLRLEARVLELEERARKIEQREEAYRRAAAQQDSALRAAQRQLESTRALHADVKAVHQRSLREAEQQRQERETRIEQLERERAEAKKAFAQQDKHVQASLRLTEENLKLKERIRALETQLKDAGGSPGE